MFFNNKMIPIIALVSFVSTQSGAQIFKPDLQNKNLWVLSGRSLENIQEKDKKGIEFSEDESVGLLLLNDFNFSNGTIEFDVKGKNVVQHSFIGIAFHIQNDGAYDAVYFRPFNFQNPDTLRRPRSVQYISSPDYNWPKLRADYPGKYENKVIPVPDPDDWFHVKLIVDGKKISVFVNNNSQESLSVQKLTNTTSGKLGLWVGTNSGGRFSNLTITAK